MSATQTVSGFSQSPALGRAGNLIGRIGTGLRRLLQPNWPLFGSSDTADELTVSHHGPVEIHQTLAGWSLETCVKGEPERARETALRRLGNFANGRNRSKMPLRVLRPLVQSAEGAGRWRVRIAVPNVDTEFVATSARNGKVRLYERNSETLAVIRVPGRPTRLAMQHAETAIRHALAVTRWQPAGGPVLRLHALPTVLPFLSRFEVAVPVIERMHGMSEWMGRAAFEQPLVRDAVTQSSPAVH